MDGTRQNFENVKNPEKLRDHLLNIVQTKLAHSAGSRYSEAVAFLLNRREWRLDEPWQAQRLVRQRVWQPLMTGI